MPTPPFELVLNGLDLGVTVQDATGAIVYANDLAAKMSGFVNAAELLSAAPGELARRFSMFDVGGAPLPFDKLPGRIALMGGGTQHTHIRFRSSGADRDRWVVLRASPIADENGAVRFVVNLFRDVTEEREREEATRVTQAWHLTVLHAIGDAVITTDAAARVTFLNPIAEALTGWPKEAAYGQPMAEVFHIVEEETRAPAVSPVERALAEGVVVGLANHTVLIARDGRERAIEDSAAPIRGGDGEIIGSVLIFRDVDARRVEERRRQFLVQAVQELNSSLDYQRTLATIAHLAVPAIADWCAVDLVQPGGLERLAVAHIDPAKIEFVAQLQRKYPPDPNSATGVPNVLRTGKAEMMAEIPAELMRRSARDPEHLTMIEALGLRSYIVVPLRRGETTIGVITLVHAESKRVYGEADLALALALADRAAIAIENARLFSELTRTKADAELANRTKDEFLAMLGHELRNPLAPILTALDILDLKQGDIPSHERTIIARQVRHMVRLVDDLLDVSRIARGKVELRKEAVDVDAVIAKAAEMAGPLVVERRHALDVRVAAGLVVEGDSVRLAQVFSNLIGNAAKYTRPGGHIEVVGERQGGQVIVRVRDDGIGISPAMLPRIFDIFVQQAQTPERSEGGLGLGLAIVRNLIMMHGGSVTARSDGLDRGTEVTVTLPASARTARETGAVPRLVLPMPGTRPRVLIVDDNADALELLALGLETMGYDVVTAADGAAAIAAATTRPPTVALLDIGLPEMDGYEVGRRLRALPGGEATRLIALTGYGQSSDIARSTAAGFADHLVKPITLAGARTAIERAVRGEPPAR